MKSAEFKVWIKSIEYLRRGQRNKLRERLEGRENIDDVIILSARKTLVFMYHNHIFLLLNNKSNCQNLTSKEYTLIERSQEDNPTCPSCVEA